MIPVKKLIELTRDPKSYLNAKKVIPLDHGAFVVQYGLENYMVCNHLGDGFRLDGSEYHEVHDFQLIDDLLYFDEGIVVEMKYAFDMAGNQVMYQMRKMFNKSYSEKDRAKYKCDFPRMKQANGEIYLDERALSELHGSQMPNNPYLNNPYRKYGVAWTVNNGLLMQLPITVEKMNWRIKDIDDFVRINEIDEFTYKYMSQYITLLRMINASAMPNTIPDLYRNIRRFDNISSFLDMEYCTKRR